MSEIVFFAFLAAIIIVPQVLRHQERGRLHETLRLAFERGQPVPPELIMALQKGRAYRYDPYLYAGANGWAPQPGVAPQPASTAATGEAAVRDAPAPPPIAPAAAAYMNPARHDLRRGVIWLGVGLGLVAAGLACYAGLYNVGGSQETLSMFAAFGAIPIFIGLTYLALWGFERRKAKA
jgi:hypothetical protein